MREAFRLAGSDRLSKEYFAIDYGRKILSPKRDFRKPISFIEA